MGLGDRDLVGAGGVLATMRAEATLLDHGGTGPVVAVRDAAVRTALHESPLGREQVGCRLKYWEYLDSRDMEDSLIYRSRKHLVELFRPLTSLQKRPQPGQHWCLTMPARWSSHRTSRWTVLDGRISWCFTTLRWHRLT